MRIIALLKDELTSDPIATGYAAMTDNEVAQSLNAKNRTRIEPVNRNDFIRWAARHDALNTLEAAASSGNPANRSIAKAVLLLVQGESNLDLGDAEIMGMIDTLVSNSIFTREQADDLVSLATVSISRAQELGISVNEGDVKHARAS